MKTFLKAFSTKLTLVMLALASMASSAMAEVKLSFDEIKLAIGKQTPVTILMDNDENGVTNLQFDLTLPENVTFVANSYALTDRKSGTQGVKMAQQPNGAYRFAITDTEKTGFSGNSGAILTFMVRATAAPAEGAVLTLDEIVAIVDKGKLSTSSTPGTISVIEDPTIYIETDLTAQFPLDYQGWNGASGYVGWAAPEVTTNDGRTTAACEKYESTCANTGVVFSRTLTGLADGIYTIELYGAAAYTPDRGFESALEEGDMTAVYLFAETGAGTVKQYIPAHIADNFNGTGIATAVLEGVEVVNGTVTIGMYKEKDLTNWHVVQVKGVTAVVPADEALAAAVAYAEAELSDKLPAAVAQELASLIGVNKDAVYGTADEYIAAIDALDEATGKAMACNIAADKLAAMKQLTDATNVYTAEALQEYYGKWAEAYENGTITINEANALQDPFALTGWHANITADNFLLSAWDTDPDFPDGVPYYINSWSTEGETDGTDFKVPFFEYWTGDAESLGEKTLTATMEGVEPGYYAISAWVRVRAKNETNAADATGITLVANDGTPVDVTEGETVDQFNLAEYTAHGWVGEDGVLRIQFVVAAENNISWLSFKNVKFEAAQAPLTPYEAALETIEDGKNYRIFTEVDGVKYYVTEAGYLTSTVDDGGIFPFQKVAGEFKEYGFKIGSGKNRFTNAPLANNQAVLNPGVFSVTTGNDRNTWEAQVFFLDENGKYAIRTTNVAYGETGWADAGRVYWTWAVEEAVVPQYSYEEAYLWQLEGPLTTIQVSYQLAEADGTPVGNPTVKMQLANSEISVPAAMTSHFAYEYAAEGTIGEEDCTITVKRTFKPGVVHALTDLSNEKAYTIRCDRGALLTKDDFLASTAHSSLTNAEAADFAVISYEDNLYLYSVADGKFVQNNGALSDMPLNGEFDAVVMEAKTDPYFFTYFKINEDTSYGLNTNGVDPYGYVINNWMTADAGNQYYMVESGDFDATEALAALEAYFHPACFVTYVVKDAAGQTIFTSEAEPTIMGTTITSLPTNFQRPFYTYNEVEETIAEEQNTVEFTATWAGPFELSANFADAKWYNMTIRSNYYVAMDETEPYYPKTKTAEELLAPETQWAFAGDGYNGIVLFNKAAGEGFSLTKVESNAVMKEGSYGWAIAQNNDGFTLREMSTENNCINQYGGTSGPLQFWNSANALKDEGSTFRVSEVNDPVTVYRDILTAAVEEAESAAANVPAGGLFTKTTEDKGTFTSAIAEQKAVAEDVDATLEDIQAAIAALATAAETFDAAPVATPAADAVFTFQQKESGLYLSVHNNGEANGVRLSETPQLFSWVEADGGYYLQSGDLFVGIAAGSTWKMSALAENKVIIKANAVLDGEVIYYTLNDGKGLIGTNEPGSEGYPNCYADKAQSDYSLFTIAEASFIQGDADGDEAVDVADHAVIRDFVLAGGGYYPVYDVNEDQDVNVGDMTAVVNVILGLPINDGAEVRGDASADVLTLNYVNGRYALQLQSGRAYNAFQMDLDVPAGMTLISEEATGNHTVMTSRLANGKTRILVFSMDNTAFESTDVLYLNVVGQGKLTAENIIFADAYANAVSLALGDATGIKGVGQNQTTTIYDLSGRKADTMRRGVNIVRTADGKTKKVLK